MPRLSMSEAERSDAQPVIGKALAHDSAAKHATGAAIYIDDIPEPPGCLHLAIGMSRRAHARVTRLDLSRVREAPGVVAVFTARDIPGTNDVGPVIRDDPLFADGVVQYVGQSLFAVAAQNVEDARKAARLADVVYEDLPAALTIAEAKAAQLEIEPPQTMTKGDVAAALAAAPRRLKGRLKMGGQDHFYLEGPVALAIPGEDGDMRVYSSTQNPRRSAASGGARSRRARSRCDDRGAPHGRRFRRQGNAAGSDRRRGRARSGEDRPALPSCVSIATTT